MRRRKYGTSSGLRKNIEAYIWRKVANHDSLSHSLCVGCAAPSPPSFCFTPRGTRRRESDNMSEENLEIPCFRWHISFFKKYTQPKLQRILLLFLFSCLHGGGEGASCPSRPDPHPTHPWKTRPLFALKRRGQIRQSMYSSVMEKAAGCWWKHFWFRVNEFVSLIVPESQLCHPLLTVVNRYSCWNRVKNVGLLTVAVCRNLS